MMDVSFNLNLLWSNILACPTTDNLRLCVFWLFVVSVMFPLEHLYFILNKFINRIKISVSKKKLMFEYH
jgi:hypothetical protein